MLMTHFMSFILIISWDLGNLIKKTLLSTTLNLLDQRAPLSSIKKSYIGRPRTVLKSMEAE